MQWSVSIRRNRTEGMLQECFDLQNQQILHTEAIKCFLFHSHSWLGIILLLPLCPSGIIRQGISHPYLLTLIIQVWARSKLHRQQMNNVRLSWPQPQCFSDIGLGLDNKTASQHDTCPGWPEHEIIFHLFSKSPVRPHPDWPVSSISGLWGPVKSTCEWPARPQPLLLCSTVTKHQARQKNLEVSHFSRVT